MNIKAVYDLIDASNAIFDARNTKDTTTGREEISEENFEYDDPNHPDAVMHPHRAQPHIPKVR